MNVVTCLTSTILSNAFKSNFRLSFASDDRKSIGPSTGVTESKEVQFLLFSKLTFLFLLF